MLRLPAEVVKFIGKSDEELFMSLSSSCKHLRGIYLAHLIGNLTFNDNKGSFKKFMELFIPQYAHYIQKLKLSFFADMFDIDHMGNLLAGSVEGICELDLSVDVDYGELLRVPFKGLRKLSLELNLFNTTTATVLLLDQLPPTLTVLELKGLSFNEEVDYPQNLKSLEEFRFSLEGTAPPKEETEARALSGRALGFFGVLLEKNAGLRKVANSVWTEGDREPALVDFGLLHLCYVKGKMGFDAEKRIVLSPTKLEAGKELENIREIFSIFNDAKGKKCLQVSEPLPEDISFVQSMIQLIDFSQIEYNLQERKLEEIDTYLKMLLDNKKRNLKLRSFSFVSGVGNFKQYQKTLAMVLSKCANLKHFKASLDVLAKLPFEYPSLQEVSILFEKGEDKWGSLEKVQSWLNQVHVVKVCGLQLEKSSQLTKFLSSMKSLTLPPVMKFAGVISLPPIDNAWDAYITSKQKAQFHEKVKAKALQIAYQQLKEDHPSGKFVWNLKVQ